MRVKIDAGQYTGNQYNDLKVLSSAEDKVRSDGYVETCIVCECVCSNKSTYKLSDVRLGRIKRCKECNYKRKHKYCPCQQCFALFAKKDLVESKRAGKTLCRPCFEESKRTTCKNCNNAVVILNGKHSGLCPCCWNVHRVCYSLLAACKHRSTKEKLEFDLDMQWFMDRILKCDVTGIDLVLRDMKVKQEAGNYSNRNPRSPSIDKINPEKGYTQDNCRIVCWWYNVAKNIWSDEQVSSIVADWIKNKGGSWQVL